MPTTSKVAPSSKPGRTHCCSAPAEAVRPTPPRRCYTEPWTEDALAIGSYGDLIVELARGSGPRTVTDLAAAVGVSNQSAAAALGRLTAARWVVAAKSETGDRRATWYDLTDPLIRRIVQYREGARLT